MCACTRQICRKLSKVQKLNKNRHITFRPSILHRPNPPPQTPGLMHSDTPVTRKTNCPPQARHPLPIQQQGLVSCCPPPDTRFLPAVPICGPTTTRVRAKMKDRRKRKTMRAKKTGRQCESRVRSALLLLPRDSIAVENSDKKKVIPIRYQQAGVQAENNPSNTKCEDGRFEQKIREVFRTRTVCISFQRRTCGCLDNGGAKTTGERKEKEK